MRFRGLPSGIILVLIVGITFGIYETSTSKKTLSDTRKIVQEDETHLVFYDNNEGILTISLLHHQGYNNKTGEMPLRVVASHKKDTTIESMNLVIKFPRSGALVEKRGEIYLKTPEGPPFPKINFERTDDLNTRLEIHDMESQGEGALQLHFLLKPEWKVKDSTNITVDINTVLTENKLFGDKYHAKGQTTVEVPIAN
ncbi:MAG: hypothetical protein ACLFMM_03550 [Methanohalobium sp.]|uniref:hypothetical protein n=1 Tax=Methanohalobium sp. TaxID=2837493 RepID=UPI003978339F